MTVRNTIRLLVGETPYLPQLEIDQRQRNIGPRGRPDQLLDAPGLLGLAQRRIAAAGHADDLVD